METVISLLRGINVGPHNRVKMEPLRAVYESLGLRDVQTYLQSGNVIFSTEKKDLTKLGLQIEAAIEKAFGFRPAVVHRTLAEMQDVIARNPFAARKDVAPKALFVFFLARDAGAEARASLGAIDCAPEELHISGDRELFLHYVNGFARPKLPPAKIERILKVPATARNWNTVRDLANRST